jgi:hypothetical protein
MGALALILAVLPANATVYYVAVGGLGGEPDYEQRFAALIKDAEKLLRESGANAKVYALSGSDATRARMTEIMGQVAREAKPEDDFLLLLIGHGTFDGIEYKFNLVGPDLSGTELAGLCDRIPAKRQLIVNTTSASGGSLAALQPPRAARRKTPQSSRAIGWRRCATEALMWTRTRR